MEFLWNQLCLEPHHQYFLKNIYKIMKSLLSLIVNATQKRVSYLRCTHVYLQKLFPTNAWFSTQKFDSFAKVAGKIVEQVMAGNPASFVLDRVHKITLDLIRVRVISYIEKGDVSLDTVRTQLQTEFEQLRDQLNKQMIKDLLSAETNIRTAMCFVNSGDSANAQRYFFAADQNATEAFTVVPDFEMKVLSIRIRILAQLHLCEYFTDSCNTNALRAVCSDLLQQILDTTEVQFALREEVLPSKSFFSMITGGTGSRSKRLSILSQVAELSTSVYALTGANIDIREAKSGTNVTLQRKTLTQSCSSTLSSLAVAEGRLFSGSYDGTIKVWDLNTLTEVGTLAGHTDGVLSLAVAEGRLYSGSYDKTIKVWDLNTLTEVGTLAGHTSSVAALAVAESKLYSGSTDKTIKVWDLNTLTEVGTLAGHTDGVLSLAVAEGRLFSGSYDKTIKVWDLNTLNEVGTLTGHTMGVDAFTVAVGCLYSRSSYNTIKVWDLSTMTAVGVFTGFTTYGVSALSVAEGRLYVGTYAKTIEMWPDVRCLLPGKVVLHI
jgi:WD40 repeat protein